MIFHCWIIIQKFMHYSLPFLANQLCLGNYLNTLLLLSTLFYNKGNTESDNINVKINMGFLTK